MATRLRRTAVAGLTLGALTALALAGGAGASGPGSVPDPPPPAGPGSVPDPPPPGSVPDPPPEVIYPATCRLVGAGEPQPIAAPIVTPSGAAPGQPFGVAPPLPAGLSIDPVTGVISGTPSAAEAGVIRVVTVGSEVADLPLTVIDASFSYPDSEPVPGRPIVPIVPTVTLTPGTEASVTFAASGLPDGLAIDPATGTITGRLADDAGRAAFTVTMSVTASDGTACGTQVESIEFEPDPGVTADDGCPTRPKRIYVPLAATRPTAQQMFTNLEHARAAVTRMNALRRWLDAGIIPRRDLCNHTIGARDIDPAVPLVRSTKRDPTANWTTRTVSGFGYDINPRGRRPLTEASFADVEARVRAAELRFIAIRAELMRGVAGADFRERMPAAAKLAQGIYAPRVSGPLTMPGAPAAAGGPDPASLCSMDGSTLDRLYCHRRRAVRMIHLSNVIRQGLLNRVHGEPAQYDVAQSTTARRGLAAARLRTACNADFPSVLCRQVRGVPEAAGYPAIDRWLTGLRNYEVRYLGGAMRHFGVADGSIGSAQMVPNSPPAS